ncbi:MAG: hypothetical protein E4H27_00595 [Anaerolineales bacterium]|nr:MAG: hypothetical protein E4H27_00595 [Anaerolineales bacterium]
MDIKGIIKSQYRASLAMLEEAITRCPETLWDDPEDRFHFWHTAYHALFFTHLYLRENEAAFVPWSKHRANQQFFESIPWVPGQVLKIGEPYSQAELLEYLAICRHDVEVNTTSVDLDAASGFDWLLINKLELQFYNIRHLQYHTGQLDDLLRNKADISIGWIGEMK